MTTHPNARKAKGFSNDFEHACYTAGLPLTHRQWRKWCQKRGLAWANRNKVKQEVTQTKFTEEEMARINAIR